MQINPKQRRVLIAAVALMVLMLVFPPWALWGANGAHLFKGYAPLWHKPDGPAAIEPDLLLLQWAAIALAAGAAWLLLGANPSDPEGAGFFDKSSRARALRARAIQRLVDQERTAGRQARKEWNLALVFLLGAAIPFVVTAANYRANMSMTVVAINVAAWGAGFVLMAKLSRYIERQRAVLRAMREIHVEDQAPPG